MPNIMYCFLAVKRLTSLSSKFINNLFKEYIMKNSKILTILLTSSIISFYACNDKANVTKIDTTNPLEVSSSPTPTNTTTPNTTSSNSSNNTGKVWHYTCKNGCDGGAESAVNCGNCGNLLAHNQAYHNNNSNVDNTSNSIPFMNPQTNEAGKNTAGVWHYTCTKGCEGGAASAGTCSNCGNTLVHNQAYHL